ncbi:MAG: DUF6599 family protein [Smithellaceae bacterium]|nr:DUF6599 family protein [Smithellaceae bacterium]
MKIWTCLLVTIWMFTGAAMAAEKEKGKMDSVISLPSEAASWKWDGKEERHNAKTLFAYMNGAAELYLAYGFQHLTVRRYEKPDRPAITVELYEMASSADAYGVFTFERQDEPAGIGQGSEFGGGMLRFWKGRYFAAVYAEGEGAEVVSALLAMGRVTADAVFETGPEPEWIALLPGRNFGLVERSVRFFRSHVLLNQRFFIAHQNILNLSRQTEALLAQYLQDEQKTHLLLLRYPDGKAAGEAYQSFMKAYLPDAGGKNGSKTEDQRWTLARRNAEMVLILFGAPTETAAEALIQAAEEKLQQNEAGRHPSEK